MKRKNCLIFLLILLLLGISAFCLFYKVQKTQQKKELYLAIPSFQLPDIDNNIITDASLKKYQTILFLFFNPDCDLCREEMEEIKLHQEAFTSGKIVFFSSLPVDIIQSFLHETGFVPTRNMLFLSDEKEILVNKMEVKTSPTVYIYRKGQLHKRFDGPVKIETLIKYLSEK
jgi:peroxiredoxin